MKYAKAFLLLAFVILLSTACSKNGQPLIPIPNGNGTKIEDIDYSISQVVLSKSYQSLEPKVEVINKKRDTILIASLGLVKSSGASVKDVIVEGNTVTIIVENEQSSTSNLVVPQIHILFPKLRSKAFENYIFEIKSENYSPIKVNNGILDTLNKLKTELKITSISTPSYELIEDDGNYIWDINYKNVYDIDNIEVPLIDLNVKVDSSNGNIISSTKKLISSLVDHGSILDFNQKQGFVYEKISNFPSSSEEQHSIWFYSFSKLSKEIAYTSDKDILLSNVSPNGEYIALVEGSVEANSSILVELDTLRAIKIPSEPSFVTRAVRWRSANEVLLLGQYKDGFSNLMLYTIDTNKLDSFIAFKGNITNIRYYGDTLLISKKLDGQRNLELSYIDKAFKENDVGQGFNPLIINDEKFIFFTADKNGETTGISMYSKYKDKIVYNLKKNIVHTALIDENDVLLIEKTNHADEFVAYKLDVNTFELNEFGNISAERVFYSKSEDTLYVDIVLPFKSENASIIYSVSPNDI